MAWSDAAALALVEAFDGAFDGAFSDEEIPVVAAAVDEAGVSIHSRGPQSGAHERFELASITKTMTATLLASAVVADDIGLDDAIGTWLRAGGSGGITVRQLATHTSGLPRLAPHHHTVDDGAVSGPYAGLTAEVAEHALCEATPTDSSYRYSNFGYQLLGLVLERSSGTQFDELLHERLFGPLRMDSARLIPGHAEERAPRRRRQARWPQPLAGAGGVEATIDDLACYIHGYLQPVGTSFRKAVALTATAQAPLGQDQEMALGWRLSKRAVLTHSGESARSSGSVAIDRCRRRGVAVMTGTGGAGDALDLATALLLSDREPALARPRPLEAEWEQRARDVVDALMAGRFADVWSAMAATVQRQLPVVKIDLMWSMRTAGAGEVSDVAITTRRLGAHVAADITVTFPRRALDIAMVFQANGELADLRILRPGASAPW